jgi:hypothetical protein
VGRHCVAELAVASSDGHLTVRRIGYTRPLPYPLPGSETAARFAAFRIVFGVVLLADLGHLYLHRGLFEPEWIRALPLRPMLLLWMLVLCAVVAGFQTRLACIANYLFAIYMVGQPLPIGQVAEDSFVISLSLLSIFLPCGDSFSLDRWLGIRPAGLPAALAAATWALALYLGVVYFDSGVRKAFSPLWRAGLGVVTPASLPSLTWTSVTWFELVPAPVLRLMGWGIIVFEILFLGAYAWRRSRIAAVLTGAILHLGICVVYPLPAFSGIVLAIYAGLLPAGWYAAIDRVDLRWDRRQPEKLAARSTCRMPHRLRWRLVASAGALWILMSAGNLLIDLLPGFRGRGEDQRWLAYRFTGLLSHGVFDDSLLRHYTYQLRLGGSGNAVPYSRNNLLAWEVRDRVWELWWKRTQSPWTPIELAEDRLRTWAGEYSPTTRELSIDARPQRVELHRVDRALFRENNSVPWRHVGRIVLRPDGSRSVIWDQPPEKDQIFMQDFMPRALAKS